MADGVNINIGTEHGRLDHAPVTIGDITGGDHIDHGKAETVDARLLLAEIEAQKRQIAELERFAFGDNRLGVSSVRDEIRGLKFWMYASTAVTVLWVLYEIVRATA